MQHPLEASLPYDEYDFWIAETLAEDDYRCHTYSPDESAQVDDVWVKLMKQLQDNAETSAVDKIRQLLQRGIARHRRGGLWSLLLGTRFIRANSEYDYKVNREAVQVQREIFEQREDELRQHYQQQAKNAALCQSQLEAALAKALSTDETTASPDSSSEKKNAAPLVCKDVPLHSLPKMMAHNRPRKTHATHILDMDIDEIAALESPGTAAATAKKQEQFAAALRQIKLDLDRTFPTHRMFSGSDLTGRSMMFNVLAQYAKYNPTVGYCQGMSSIAAMLLMHLDEESTFWALVSIFERPKYLSGYYDTSLHRIQHHADVFNKILSIKFPALSTHLENLGIHPLMYTVPWFMCMFTSLPCWDTVLAIWDMLMLEGVVTIFRVAICLMDVCKEELLAMDGVEQILPYLQHPPVNRVMRNVFVPKLLECDISKAHIDAAEGLLKAESAPVAVEAVAQDSLPESTKPVNDENESSNGAIKGSLVKATDSGAVPKASRFKRLLSNMATSKAKAAISRSISSSALKDASNRVPSNLRARLSRNNPRSQPKLSVEPSASSMEEATCGSNSALPQGEAANYHPLLIENDEEGAGDRSFLDASFVSLRSTSSPTRSVPRFNGNMSMIVSSGGMDLDDDEVCQPVQALPEVQDLNMSVDSALFFASRNKAHGYGAAGATARSRQVRITSPVSGSYVRSGWGDRTLPMVSPMATPSSRKLVKGSPSQMLSFREFNTTTPLRQTQTKQLKPFTGAKKRELATAVTPGAHSSLRAAPSANTGQSHIKPSRPLAAVPIRQIHIPNSMLSSSSSPAASPFLVRGQLLRSAARNNAAGKGASPGAFSPSSRKVRVNATQSPHSEAKRRFASPGAFSLNSPGGRSLDSLGAMTPEVSMSPDVELCEMTPVVMSRSRAAACTQNIFLDMD
ncbi:gh regulated tbc protein-1 [Capsaspora owczarzaki ATCC 30864]|uniref:Gh regulated tbc protein-1 n=1 Tax=Capsaspora owczarzaki (strain ATCC 30864) TaxID=595528 RepID=A0A0D2U3A2_CAPO3|nr:gh regulated tbc protein-1 [Capsaspora owczarzaki ATCC 30864]KJE89651.1 gh regulated tbc protein-1 [Capsaspora owczarzaki ATCC 30864]|eukprot:XP_004365959.2 gh regulated tbc protein-1 [Capsaspora owczarzaki ATCC 30864]